MKKIRKLILANQQLISYLFWGVLTTFVNWGTYSIFVFLLNKMLSDNITLVVALANILSWVIASLFAFVTNKIWVFHSTSWKFSALFPEITKFFSTRLGTGVFEFVAVPYLVNIGLNQTIWGIDGMVAKAICSFIVVVLNYFFSKFLIFRMTKE